MMLASNKQLRITNVKTALVEVFAAYPGKIYWELFLLVAWRVPRKPKLGGEGHG